MWLGGSIGSKLMAERVKKAKSAQAMVKKMMRPTLLLGWAFAMCITSPLGSGGARSRRLRGGSQAGGPHLLLRSTRRGRPGRDETIWGDAHAAGDRDRIGSEVDHE